MTAMKIFHLALIGLLLLFISSAQNQNSDFGSESYVITMHHVEMLQYFEVSCFDVCVEYAAPSIIPISLPAIRRVGDKYDTPIIDHSQGRYDSLDCKYSKDIIKLTHQECNDFRDIQKPLLTLLILESKDISLV